MNTGYKVAWAMFLWGVLIVMVTFTFDQFLLEFVSRSVLLGAAIAGTFLCMFGVAKGQHTSANLQYAKDLEHYAKVNKSHLCPGCAKYMNDNRYRISRV